MKMQGYPIYRKAYIFKAITLIGMTLLLVVMPGCSSGSPSSNPSRLGTSTLHQSFSTSIQRSYSLAALVVGPPPEFVSEKVDALSGGATGSIGYNEASSADCAVNVPHSSWIASELKYYKANASLPKTYILLCVTELRSIQDARAELSYIVSLPHLRTAFSKYSTGFKSVKVTGAPDAVENHINSSVLQVEFTEGNYLVGIVATSLSFPTRVASVATFLANAQARRILN